MTIAERYNFQMGKENKYIVSNNNNNAVDNFILARERIKKKLQEKEQADATAKLEKEIPKSIEFAITKEIEKIFK